MRAHNAGARRSGASSLAMKKVNVDGKKLRIPASHWLSIQVSTVAARMYLPSEEAQRKEVQA
jgi:hypothetical protein